MALIRLVRHPIENVRHVVVTVADKGILGDRIESSNVDIIELKCKRSIHIGRALLRCLQIATEVKPDIVQTWLYKSDLLGAIIAKAYGCKLVWGIHNFSLSYELIGPRGWIIARICGFISKWMPTKIITCSINSIETHREHGYEISKFVPVPNGYDLNEFKRIPDARKTYCSAMGIPEDAFIFGCAARWSPVKGYRNLFLAFAGLCSVVEDAYLVIFGPLMTDENEELMKLVIDCGVDLDRIRLGGYTTAMPEVMSFIDLHVLASASEAFPNVVAEAMACETPCIVTDVGDTRIMTGGLGWVIPPSNPIALKLAMTTAMERSKDRHAWEERRKACRQRIIVNYGIDAMANNYLSVWNSVATRRHQPC